MHTTDSSGRTGERKKSRIRIAFPPSTTDAVQAASPDKRTKVNDKLCKNQHLSDAGRQSGKKLENYGPCQPLYYSSSSSSSFFPPLISRGYGGPFVGARSSVSLALGGDTVLGGSRATVTTEREKEEDGEVQESVVTVGKRKKWRADRVSRRQIRSNVCKSLVVVARRGQCEAYLSPGHTPTSTPAAHARPTVMTTGTRARPLNPSAPPLSLGMREGGGEGYAAAHPPTSHPQPQLSHPSPALPPYQHTCSVRLYCKVTPPPDVGSGWGTCVCGRRGEDWGRVCVASLAAWSEGLGVFCIALRHFFFSVKYLHNLRPLE
ncbi:hypothetical protein E2C01_044616 [Portunus trituberculatus]|uniref:Uncharacterized protein n=1 Tax=Portunus trituberculatus TaxID=210409 RepID=A0A5B7FW39_PORTR|nr:hypothetical protein [Portunus trituberculatus]